MRLLLLLLLSGCAAAAEEPMCFLVHGPAEIRSREDLETLPNVEKLPCAEAFEKLYGEKGR